MSRAELIGALEHSAARPIVLLSAGPGWGKTMLLVEWSTQSQRPFAWVSADSHDNDPVVLLTYIAAALDRVCPLDPSVFEALGSPGVSVEGTLVPRVGTALATMGHPMVLVLDDIHLIDNPTCLDAIAMLTSHVAAGSQLALSSRGHPALSLGALRAHALTVEIGPRELRMEEAEARELVRATGLELSDSEVAELTERTEGWAAGLYLAALSAKASGMGNGEVTRFRGDDRFVADYLASELLTNLPRDELRFLTRTAVLEPLSAPLCDAVLDETGSEETLDALAKSNLFLVSLDRAGEWYRYHHLFRELLRSQLQRAEPGRVQRLLIRASDWCAANGQPEAAIGYAQAGGDVDRVAQFVLICGVSIYHSGRVATVKRWLEWLEAHGALERHAPIAVLGALLATAWGRSAEVERWASAAEKASYQSPLPDGSTSIDSWRALLRAQLCRSGVARMAQDAELAVQTLSRGSQLWPHALGLLAIARFLAGDVDQADDLLADVLEAAREVGEYEVAAMALGERAAVALGRGAWVGAEEYVDRALRLIRQNGLDEYPTSALVYATAARVAIHRGDTQGAQGLLGRAQRLRPQLTYAMPYWAVQTRCELARAYLALADAGGAETMFREIGGLLRRQPDLGLLPAEVDELRERLKTVRACVPGASTLTEAELRLLPFLATHLSFREIGERLFVSRHTVKSHAVAVYRKLKVSSRSDAVERAGQLGLL